MELIEKSKDMSVKEKLHVFRNIFSEDEINNKIENYLED